MNYYKRNIGDYAAATRHLSILEHGVYTLAMDFYYNSEQPLPVELKEVCRKLGARSKDECAAVDAVLKDFFTLTDAGWIQSRCDTEIAEYQRKAETNRVIGSKGGRPKKQTTTVDSDNPEITQTVSSRNPQETLTTNQEPITIKQKNTSAPPDGVSLEIWRDFLKTRKTKVTETALAGIRREAEKAGVSLETALETSCARGWQSFKADWFPSSSAQPTGGILAGAI